MSKEQAGQKKVEPKKGLITHVAPSHQNRRFPESELVETYCRGPGVTLENRTNAIIDLGLLRRNGEEDLSLKLGAECDKGVVHTHQPKLTITSDAFRAAMENPVFRIAMEGDPNDDQATQGFIARGDIMIYPAMAV